MCEECFSQFKKIKNKRGAIVLHIKYLRQTMFRLICLHTHAHSPIYLAHLGFSRWSFGHAHSVQHHLKLLLKTRCALRSMFLKDSTETLRTITVPSHTHTGTGLAWFRWYYLKTVNIKIESRVDVL